MGSVESDRVAFDATETRIEQALSVSESAIEDLQAQCRTVADAAQFLGDDKQQKILKPRDKVAPAERCQLCWNGDGGYADTYYAKHGRVEYYKCIICSHTWKWTAPL